MDDLPSQLGLDIREALLNLPATKGKPEIHEKQLRPIAAMLRRKSDALAESTDRF